jgi:predicted DNA binding CopG/RHH family protein
MDEAPRPMRALTDEQLRAIIEPVKDLDYTQWSEEQAWAEQELDVREHESGEGQRFETMAEAATHAPGTVPISIRMPSDLLERVRKEAQRRNTPYQRLIKDLVEAGLAANAQPLPRLEVSAELLRRIADEQAVIVEVRRAS